MKTTYNVFSLPNKDLCSFETVEKLNLLGDEGWEFISLSLDNKSGLFKRIESEVTVDIEFESLEQVSKLTLN